MAEKLLHVIAPENNNNHSLLVDTTAINVIQVSSIQLLEIWKSTGI